MRKLIEKYKQLPENLKIILTALIGAAIGFITYEIVYFINPISPKASTSWIIAFIIDVARQHALHRWLTFNHKTNYWKSLFRAYIMYSGSLLITTALNWTLTEILDFHYRLAWLICLLIKALISLVFLKKFVFKPETTE